MTEYFLCFYLKQPAKLHFPVFPIFYDSSYAMKPWPASSSDITPIDFSVYSKISDSKSKAVMSGTFAGQGVLMYFFFVANKMFEINKM